VSFPNGLRGLAGRRGPIEPKGLNKVRPYLAVRTLRRLRTADRSFGNYATIRFSSVGPRAAATCESIPDFDGRKGLPGR
jgi:hypothetical protein